MAVYLGRNSSVGLSEETTWGTPTSRTNWRPLANVSLYRKVTQVPRPDLKSDATSAMRRSHFVSEDATDGSASLVCNYGSMGLFLKHAMGTAAAPSGSDPYTHVYTLAASQPTGLTVEVVRGTSTKSEVFEGCKINTATFSVSAGDAMMLDLDFIGQTAAARGSAGTPSFAAEDLLVLHSHAGQLNFNSVNYDLRSMTLTISNSLDRRQLLGSAETKEPVRSDFMSVTLDVELEAVDTLYAAQLAGTQGDVTIAFAHPTVSNRSITFLIENAYLATCDDSISDAGVVSLSGQFMAESDGTNEGLKVTVINGNSSNTGN